MHQKLETEGQTFLQNTQNYIDNEAKVSNLTKKRLLVISAFVSVVIVVLVVSTSLNQAKKPSKKDPLIEDSDYYVYEDYAHSDHSDDDYYEDNQEIPDYTHIGGHSREDAEITKVELCVSK